MKGNIPRQFDSLVSDMYRNFFYKKNVTKHQIYLTFYI